MKNDTVKQVSTLLCIIGLIILVWTFTVAILQGAFTITRYITIGILLVGTTISFIGMKRTGFLIQLSHIFFSYSCLLYSLLKDPISITAIVFLIISYFLCREYEFIFQHKVIIVILLVGYLVIASLSILLFKKSIEDLITFNFLCIFIIAFIETIQRKNEKKNIELVDKGVEIIEKLEKHNDGIIQKLEQIEKKLIK